MDLARLAGEIVREIGLAFSGAGNLHHESEVRYLENLRNS